ncbi:MAG: hypothetical protein U9Q61_05660 [Thermodesulfobacteriota bacterium]|nr:hypothetical protein [Thermodesulfobacteriota bacterium]
MLEPGKQISVYRIKEILSEEATHVCCLTNDPFFHSAVLLKVYKIDFLLDQQQRDQLVAQLEKLLLLEHPSIAPVFDSGFEGQYFYYTTNYNYTASLADRTAASLPSEDILKIVRDLGDALEYSVDCGVGHGHLKYTDIYFGDETQVVIADFGIEHCFKCFMENQESAWSEQQALEDLGRLQLQLLRPSDMDNRGRELDHLSGIENEKLRKLTERFFTGKEDRYWSFSELIDTLDSIIKAPPVETRPMVQQKSLQTATDNGITKQQREQVLPHVRQLIAERNQYKTLLDEALLGQNKIESQLNQTLLELEQLSQPQLTAPVGYSPENRRKVATWVLGGFLFGVILSGSYGYTLQQKNLNPVLPEHQVEKPLATVTAESPEVSRPPVVVKEPEPTKAPMISHEPENIPSPETKKAVELASQQIEQQQEQIPVIAEEPLHQWWPAGGEFSAAVTESEAVATSSPEDSVVTSLSGAEQGEIFDHLLSWVDSWSEQQLAAYFSHYSGQYRPELGKSREEWLNLRKGRLQRPDWIKVTIQDVRMHRRANNQVQVKFQQTYRSDHYQDRIMKSLNFIIENGEWKILTERSLGRVALFADKR